MLQVLYALICTYYFLLTGKPPFEAENWLALGYLHRSMPFPDPRSFASAIPTPIPEAVCEVLRRGAQKEASQRFQTAADVILALERLSEHAERVRPARSRAKALTWRC